MISSPVPFIIIFFIILFLIIIFFNNSYSQNKLSIIVKDSLNQPLETVNVQVIHIKSNKIVAFGVTDQNGVYLTEVKETSFYKIKTKFSGNLSCTHTIGVT